MIHYTREGHPVKTGFNFTVSWDWRRFWFKVVYAQFDAATNNLTTWRFRFRSFLYPFILTGKYTYNVVEWTLWNRDMTAIPREIYEDLSLEIKQYEAKRVEATGPENGKYFFVGGL